MSKTGLFFVKAIRSDGTFETVRSEFITAAALLDAKPFTTNFTRSDDGLGYECNADFETREDAECFERVLDESGKYDAILTFTNP